MIETLDFTTVDEMLDFFSPWGNNLNLDGFVFRGHSQESYELVPAALRLDNVDCLWRTAGFGKPIDSQFNWEMSQRNAEYSVLREFYRLADKNGLNVPESVMMRYNLAQDFDSLSLFPLHTNGFWIPNDLLETAALAQHYGIPTRLLDWTYDIFVALYFALTGAIDKDGKLEIWALNKEYISFLKPTVGRTNINFITPHYASNPNLNAQKGLFTHWPTPWLSSTNEIQLQFEGRVILVDRRPLNVLVADQYQTEDDIYLFKRFTLPCSQAKRGCVILSKLGYDAARIFPGYNGVAQHLLNRYRLS